jgi:two-component system, LuxR family, response regulator FixJ
MGSSGTVHLVDDEPEFLAATARLVRKSGFHVETHPSVEDLLENVSPETRGCVIADLVMPGISGLQLQAMLTRSGITMPVVFLTGQADVPSSVQAMRSGAVDFLEKLAPKEQLLAAIARALERDAETHNARMRLEERRSRLATLTERERTVLALVVRGDRNKQIAGFLGVTERTVKLHRAAITAKLGVHSVAQLAILASEAHLETEPRASPKR